MESFASQRRHWASAGLLIIEIVSRPSPREAFSSSKGYRKETTNSSELRIVLSFMTKRLVTPYDENES
jgi:hypothetical protein